MALLENSSAGWPGNGWQGARLGSAIRETKTNKRREGEKGAPCGGYRCYLGIPVTPSKLVGNAPPAEQRRAAFVMLFEMVADGVPCVTGNLCVNLLCRVSPELGLPGTACTNARTEDVRPKQLWGSVRSFSRKPLPVAFDAPCECGVTAVRAHDSYTLLIWYFIYTTMHWQHGNM